MELWIRSQDREKLIKVKGLYVEKYPSSNNRYAIYNFFYDDLDDCDIPLGTYETRERALEVLDEIEERIMLINTINIAKDRDSLIAYKNALTEEKIKGLGYPYQMPKK